MILLYGAGGEPGRGEIPMDLFRKQASYANNDVTAFNNSLKQQAMKWLEEKKKKVEAYFCLVLPLA